MFIPPTPFGLSQRLALVLQSLRAAIAACAGRDRTAVAVVLLAWPYLHRLAARFAALAARVRAGEASVAPTRVRTTAEAPRLRPAPLPQGFAWLIRLAPEAAALGGQVRHLLADPELAALLAVAPQAARLLRPLCRMLGIEAAPGLPAALFGPPDPLPPPPPSPARALPAAETCAALSPAVPSPAPDQPDPLPPPPPPPRRRARRVPAFGAALA